MRCERVRRALKRPKAAETATLEEEIRALEESEPDAAILDELRVEPFGEVLHVLGHRARDVHQAEHHRLGDGPRIRLEESEPDAAILDELRAELERLRTRSQRIPYVDPIDDLDVLVAPGQEDVQQDVEPFGEVLHVLGHRARIRALEESEPDAAILDELRAELERLRTRSQRIPYVRRDSELRRVRPIERLAGEPDTV
jgi:uncharacterized sporulation protein YeaH/YhbH (DUF444 family)